MVTKRKNFYQTLSEAIRDITEHGFDSTGRLAYWTHEIRRAAEASLMPQWRVEALLNASLGAIYRRLIDRGQVAKYHQGLSMFTKAHLAPKLHAELTRRVMNAASLIKLNREEAMATTIRRFEGWAGSIPAGGTGSQNSKKVASELRKSLAGQPFRDRRVLIDQGHKLTSSLNQIIATDGGAIAMIWHSHWRQANYNYREDHKERDGQCYAIKGNWALQRGLMKAGDDGYYDDITKVGEEVFCRCWAQYIYTLDRLPEDMLTKKGRDTLADTARK